MSIRLKTLLGIAAIEIALLAVLIANGIGFLRASSEDLIRARAQATAELIAATAVDAAVALDLGALETLVRASAALPATAHVRILDRSGRTLAQADGPSTGVDAEILRHAAEIRAAGRVFATVEVGLSTEDLAASVARAQTRMGWIAGVEVALVAIFGLALGTAFVNRLRDLAHGAARLAAGDLSVRVVPHGRDELARTAHAFNAMAEKLARTLERVESARAKAETRLAEAIEELPHAVAMGDADGRIVFANPSFVTTIRRLGADVDARATIEGMDGVLAAATVAESDGVSRLTDGRSIVVHKRGLSGGEAIRVHTDVTPLVTAAERNRQLEREMAQVRRLETLGSLAGGIAHEINTPIQFVGDNLRFLEEGLTHLVAAKAGDDFPVEEIPAALRQSREGVERIARIVSAIKSMAEPTAGVTVALDARAAMGQAVDVTANVWRGIAAMEVDAPDGLPMPPTRAGEIEQVLVGLIVNAAHAIEGRGGAGTIRISARAHGEDLEIAVRDDGPGVPPALRSRIFDPFFTTKSPGKGTGQGLAVARAVVEAHHGGTLVLRSPPEGGAEFAMILPARRRATVGVAA
ncbi:MAG: ATP-binding protein [Magnetospirillum sp.]|nr:ATP-binding protein [Magnetospirillum sp.]